MENAARTLVETVRSFIAEGQFAAEGGAGEPEDDVWGDADQLAMTRQMFEAAAAGSVPKGFDSALLLPDEVRLRWQDGAASGELNVVNPQMSLEHELDESLLGQSVGGVMLGETRIIDRVVDTAGPLYTLWRPGGPDPDRLFLFDLTHVDPLDCGLESYLAAAAAGIGITFWQRLFADGKLTPDVAKAIEERLDWLETHRPGTGLGDLRDRLAART